VSALFRALHPDCHRRRAAGHRTGRFAGQIMPPLTIGSIRERTMSESLIAGCSRYGLAVGIARAGNPAAARRSWACEFVLLPAGNRHGPPGRSAAPTHRLSERDGRTRMPPSTIRPDPARRPGVRAGP